MVFRAFLEPSWKEASGRNERNLGKKRKNILDDINAIKDIAARYLLLLVASANNLWIFYFLFTVATIQTSAFLLRFFYPVEVYGSAILVENSIISMVKACVAGAAYYLLLILNLTTSKIRFRKRILVFLFDALLFFVLNTARISLLAVMQARNLAVFDITHKIFWYGISTIYVVLIWLLTIKIFRIKEIPVYSDFAFLKRQLK